MVKQRSRYMLAKNRRAGPKVLSPDATQKTAIAQAPVFTIITRRVNLKRSNRAKPCVFASFTRRVNRKLGQHATPRSQPDPPHAKPSAIALFCVAAPDALGDGTNNLRFLQQQSRQFRSSMRSSVAARQSNRKGHSPQQCG